MGKVHPHGRGDGNAIQPSPRKIKRFTPTGVGTANQVMKSSSIVTGSPPRAWGRLTQQSDGQLSSRFTPTGVGTALWVGMLMLMLKVHPHGRGDGFLTLSIAQPSTRFTPTGVGTASTDS